MFIQHIFIQQFGSIHTYEAALSPTLNLLDSRYTDEITAAIAFLLCNRTAPGIPALWLQENTVLSATVLLAQTAYTVCAKPVSGQLRLLATDQTGQDVTAQYQYALSHCPEQDAVEAFDGKDHTVPFRLHRYYCREDHDELSGRTGYLADTKAFRRYLLQYMQAFRPEQINCRKDYQTAMDGKGKFTVVYPAGVGKAHLSETEKRLFRYICFLQVAEFWAGFESLRDLHHEKKPLLVRNFVEFLDNSANVGCLLVRTQKLQRQVIILASPLDEESKKKWMGA